MLPVKYQTPSPTLQVRFSTEALCFYQEVSPDIKCYIAPIKSRYAVQALFWPLA